MKTPSKSRKLTKQEFSEKLKNNRLALTFIGMSNIGKSYWSRKLAEIGFKHIDCDGRIENKLKQRAQTIKNHGTAGLAEWMGFPHEKRFLKTQAQYLNAEKEVMTEIIDDLNQEIPGNIAIDTSGSFIYAGHPICEGIRKKSLIVYIKPPEEMKKKLFENFIKNPKPVIWGDMYEKKEHESKMGALDRCYPKLLDYRSKLYEKYADISISYESIYGKTDAEEFLELIKNQL